MEVSQKELWLYNLRDFNIDGVASSGPHIISPIFMYEIAKATGCCFVEGQSKEDWREVIHRYFRDRAS